MAPATATKHDEQQEQEQHQFQFRLSMMSPSAHEPIPGEKTSWKVQAQLSIFPYCLFRNFGSEEDNKKEMWKNDKFGCNPFKNTFSP